MEAIAEMFEKHLKPRNKILPGQLIDVAGLESVFVTEIVKRSAWEVCSAWSWRGRSRINVLELPSTFQSIKKVARSGGGRVVLLLDSPGDCQAKIICKGTSAITQEDLCFRAGFWNFNLCTFLATPVERCT